MPTYFGGTGVGTLGVSANFVYFLPATCTLSGNVTDGQVYYNSGSGNIKLAVYADSGGTPGAKLGESDVLALERIGRLEGRHLLDPVRGHQRHPLLDCVAVQRRRELGDGRVRPRVPFPRFDLPDVPWDRRPARRDSSNNNLGMQVGVTAAVTPPVAAFSGTPLTGDAPLNVAFTDASTNTPISWAWDFGDAGTSTSQNPSHTYTSAGTYTVELDATNAGGTDNEAKVAYVTVTEVVRGISLAPDDGALVAAPTWEIDRQRPVMDRSTGAAKTR